ncbi:hypothetical protein GW930_00155 [Candidatus Saccharibacteria bacterium]|nr:hypothetical protein [Candidatus Saccharibacteria bacterium]
MRVAILTKDHTDYARDVTMYVDDFHRVTGHDLEVMDPESPAGVDFCRTYDIMQIPTVVALTNDGRLLQQWPGLPLPTISELSYYAAQP